jgi:hypothetical protein
VRRGCRCGDSTAAGGSCCGGAGSSEEGEWGGRGATQGGSMGPREFAHARGGLEAKRGGGLPVTTTAARCSGLERQGWRGGWRNAAAFYRAQTRGDDAVTTAIPPYYSALAGACTAGTADGPAVPRAHGARTAPQRCGRGTSGGVSLGRRGS